LRGDGSIALIPTVGQEVDEVSDEDLIVLLIAMMALVIAVVIALTRAERQIIRPMQSRDGFIRKGEAACFICHEDVWDGSHGHGGETDYAYFQPRGEGGPKVRYHYGCMKQMKSAIQTAGVLLGSLP
jgi:hypothetical protein